MVHAAGRRSRALWPEGPHLIALAFGPAVLVVNSVCVLVLARWGSKRAASPRALLDQIIANPLILACAAGLIAQALSPSRDWPAERRCI